MTLKPIALCLLALPAHAAGTWTETLTFTSGALIPDNNLIGVADSRQAVTTVTGITGLRVFLNISGGWNGDLYAYLSHGEGFAILLNRPGRTTADPDGSGSSGMHVAFDDAAASDLHLSIPAAGLVTGTYQPDGRDVLPAASFDTTPRTASLSSFHGLDPNGEWTLYVADASLGSVATLTSWSLAITGVPEPSTALLSALGCLASWSRNRQPPA